MRSRTGSTLSGFRLPTADIFWSTSTGVMRSHMTVVQRNSMRILSVRLSRSLLNLRRYRNDLLCSMSKWDPRGSWDPLGPDSLGRIVCCNMRYLPGVVLKMSIDVENEQARCKMVAPPRLGGPGLNLADVIFGTIEILHEWVFQFDYLNGDCWSWMSPHPRLVHARDAGVQGPREANLMRQSRLWCVMYGRRTVRTTVRIKKKTHPNLTHPAG